MFSDCTLPCVLRGEIWKDIPGFEGLYQVSTIGRVKSLDREVEIVRLGITQRQKWPGQILALNTRNDGYIPIYLRKEGKTYTRLVHQLVLEAFVGKKPPNCEGCHNNNVKWDNRLVNLRWDTRSGNNKDRRFSGIQTKLCLAQALKIREAYANGGISQQRLANRYGISQAMVSSIILGRTWQV